MKASLNTKTGELTIVLPANTTNPPRSQKGTGPTLIVATTGGNQKSEINVNGQQLVIGVNAYIYAEPKAPKA